jgi:adenosylcobyric acid synthase
VAVLDAADQRHLAGFLVNKFRGDQRLLQPGLDWLRAATGRPCMGVLPWLPGLWLDAEDSLDLESRPAPVATAAVDQEVLQVAVVRLPRMSNVTDLDPLSAETGVAVRLTTSPTELLAADLVIVPGSRATVRDLAWLRECGIDDVLARRASDGRPVLGICGGLQMLGELIDDSVESGAGVVAGLGLLPVRSVFAREKTLDLPVGEWSGHPVGGYRIQHGRVSVAGGEPFLDGCQVGATWGTTWHGVFEHDGFRREFLCRIAVSAGRAWRPGWVSFAEIRETRLDLLGDLIEQYVDTAAIWRLLEGGVPAGLPALTLAIRSEVPVP